MKQKISLASSTSILIGAVIAILALLRGTKSHATRMWAARPLLWGFSKLSRRRRPRTERPPRRKAGEQPIKLRIVRSLIPGGKIFKNTK